MPHRFHHNLAVLLTLFFLASTNVSSFCQKSSMATIAKENSDAVVTIDTYKNGKYDGEGSGFVVRADGIIATNYHVIQGIEKAKITLSNGDNYDSVYVLDVDEAKDLALLRIKALNLPTVKLGDSDRIEIGQHVIAIGNPQGLSRSVSDGIVSAIRQQEGFKAIQTTAPISPGSSGGPLIIDSGEVIGITYLTYGGQNLNLAVPINYLKSLLHFVKTNDAQLLSEFTARSQATEPSKSSTNSAVTSGRIAPTPDSVSPQNPVSATTDDGRKVLLFNNGTYRFVDPGEQSLSGLQPSGQQFTRAASATQKVISPVGKFAVWIDPAKWRVSGKGKDGRIEFSNTDGTIYAAMITESIPLSMELLKEAALINAQNQDPDARVIYEQYRIVNGVRILCLKMGSTYKAVPIVYYGYYFTGKTGTIQLLTFGIRSVFAEKEGLLTEFLNGLEISDSSEAYPEPSVAEDFENIPGLVSLGSGRIAVAFDPSKWTSEPPDQDGDIALNYGSSTGYLIAREQNLTTAELLESFIAQFKEDDPNAKVVLREKRSVNGIDVACIKMEVKYKQRPLVFYGYFYSGNTMGIQLGVFTPKENFKENEKEITTLLNGLRIKR